MVTASMVIEVWKNLLSPLKLLNQTPLSGGSFNGWNPRSNYGRAGGSPWSPVGGGGNVFFSAPNLDG